MKNNVEDLALVHNQDCTKPTQVKAPRFKFLWFYYLKVKYNVFSQFAHVFLS